jgi:ABC-type sugar transport system substrate-binding protein
MPRSARKILTLLSLAVAAMAVSLVGAGVASAVTPPKVDTNGTWPSSPGPKLPASYSSLAGYAGAVKQAESPVKWDGPTTKVKPPKKGFLAAIGCSKTFAGCYVGLEGALAAAKKVGWGGSMTNVTNTTDLDQAVQTAILHGATAIVLQGIDQTNIPIGLAEARRKNIPVISTFNEDKPNPKGVNYEVNPDADFMGQALADAMIANNKGKVNALFLDDNEYGLPIIVLQQLRKQLEACKICKNTIKDLNFTANQVTTTLPTALTSALRTNPSINAIGIGYDAPTDYLVPALNSAHLQNQAPFYSQLGLTLNFIHKKDAFANDMAASLSWSGWAAMDEIFRYLNGKPFVPENIPAEMFGYSNTPANGAQFTGNSSGFQQKYLSLWGK